MVSLLAVGYGPKAVAHLDRLHPVLLAASDPKYSPVSIE